MTNEDRAFLDEHHICRGCNKAKAFPGRKYCPECLEKIAERNARAYAKPDRLSKMREYHRMLYHRRKDAGLCVSAEDLPRTGCIAMRTLSGRSGARKR